VDWRFGHVRVRQAVLEAGARLEDESDLPKIPEYRPMGSADPKPSMAFDEGYVRRIRKGPRRNFEILTGAIRNHRRINVFATAYPARAALPSRLRRFTKSAGVPDGSTVRVMTDGASSLLRLPPMLPFKTQFVLDYFHVAMKLRHIDQTVSRIPSLQLTTDGSIFEFYDRSNYLRAYVWTGRREKVFESIDIILSLLNRAKVVAPDLARDAEIVAGHVLALWHYLRANAAGVINYRAWRREGHRISTSAVEAIVNRLIGRRLGKNQHMCWTKRGAHLLLQVRCTLLNDQLLRVFNRWHPEIGDHCVTHPWQWRSQHS